jgi:hypothetical protein
VRNDREPNDVDYYWTLNNMPLYGPAKSISKRLSVLKKGGGGADASFGPDGYSESF